MNERQLAEFLSAISRDLANQQLQCQIEPMEEHEAKLAHIQAFVRCLFTLEMLLDARDALNLEIKKNGATLG